MARCINKLTLGPGNPGNPGLPCGPGIPYLKTQTNEEEQQVELLSTPLNKCEWFAENNFTASFLLLESLVRIFKGFTRNKTYTSS